MQLVLDPNNVDDYRLFVRAKGLPQFRCRGREIYVPDQYAAFLGLNVKKAAKHRDYKPWPGLFDYQADVSGIAIAKRKYAVFACPGLGKTFISTEYARYCLGVIPRGRRILMVAPSMVVKQTMQEAERFYRGEFPLQRVEARDLASWNLGKCGTKPIGITNYEALRDDTPRGVVSVLIPDESGCMKSADGVWGNTLIRLGDGLDWKLSLTGTPAPNDRIEFANQAVFLDAFPTTNAFLARYFVNRGQTNERWEMKPHALEAFYRELSHWCIFLTNPATYGWKDNCANIPPINVHIHDIEMTQGQRDAVFHLTGRLFSDKPGGIGQRSKMSRIGKGEYNGQKIDALKPQFIKDLIASWPDESTILWCWFNQEQDNLAKEFPEAANIDGSTPMAEREELIDDFKAGRRKLLLTKPHLLGHGMNFQVATRQVFSSLLDSYEKFFQAVKRSNRYGSTRALNVHLPVTECERPMIETVLMKAHRVQEDTECQERLFKENAYGLSFQEG